MSVSAILTCHNEEAFVEQAVMSVVGQTAYDRISEIIVVNDGSSDGSQKLLERLAERIPKLRIVVTAGLGPSAARNEAIGRCSGEFIAFLDGDDFWTAEKIERQIEAFALSPEIGLVYSDFYDFTLPDASDALFLPVRPYHYSDTDTLAGYFVHDAPIIPSTAIVRLETLHDVGLFDTDLRVCEDMEICLRIAERWTFEHVPGGFAYKRRHGKNLTAQLERLLPVAQMLTERFTARNPSLRPLAAKRMARRFAAAANDCSKHGERAKALFYLWQSFRSDPFFLRGYGYLALAFIPSRAGTRLRHMVRGILRLPSRSPG